jgi:2',3'-cyclic-nucleotide 2'-phosphodiesterase (5'-nucleotidase family)
MAHRARSLLLALALVACASPAPSAPEAPAPLAPLEPPPPPTRIVLLGTSDLHGHLDKLPLLGGYLARLRADRRAAVVLLDGGDMFQGTLESNQGEGASVIVAYRALGYDAVTIGNHEFDYGPVGLAATAPPGATGPEADPRGALKARAAEAAGAFPVLAANLLEDGARLGWANVVPSALVSKAGVWIGLIGVTTLDTPRTTIAANVVGIEVTPLADAIAAEAAELRRRGARLVFVAAHAGGECKAFERPLELSSCDGSAEIFQVAEKLPRGVVDAIVAGHTHKSIAHEVNGVAIIQSGAYGLAVGKVEFEVPATASAPVRHTLTPPFALATGALLNELPLAPDPTIAALVEPAMAAARARREEPLGLEVARPFPSAYRAESALGNLVASLLREVSPGAQIGIMNAGGLRADLAPGPLRYGMLYEVLPFDNRLARLTMTGRSLRETFRRNLSGKRGLFSIAGGRVVASCRQGELAVDVFLPDGKRGERPLGDDERVEVVTNEFLASRGDDFGEAERVELDHRGPPFRDLLRARLSARGGPLRPEDWLVPDRPRIVLPVEPCLP